MVSVQNTGPDRCDWGRCVLYGLQSSQNLSQDVRCSGRTQPGTPDGGGFIIQEDEETFTCVGLGYRLEFNPRYGDSDPIAYDFVEEGRFVNDQWIPGRWLNGDEVRDGVKLGKTPEARRVRVYSYR